MKRIKSLYILLNNLQERWFKSVKIMVMIRGRVGQHGGGGGVQFYIVQNIFKIIFEKLKYGIMIYGIVDM